MTRQGRPKTLCTNRPWQELAWIDCQKEFFVVNTTVLSNKMYRDNPLAFWSETADNSLNWKLQPELNYPELPWKLQTTKLNYNYLEYRSKTAGNSLFVIIDEDNFALICLLFFTSIFTNVKRVNIVIFHLCSPDRFRCKSWRKRASIR